MATDEPRDEPSGVTTQGILDDLLTRRVKLIADMFDASGRAQPKREIREALLDGYRNGFRQCVADLKAMNVVRVVVMTPLPDAPAAELTHGDNRECPDVQAGRATRCPGHPIARP